MSLFIIPFNYKTVLITKHNIIILIADFIAVNELPVLKADAIKYVMTFRTVLPSEIVASTLPQLIRHMTSESAVVHTYAACALEKILMMKDKSNQPL